jgi:hypothetical protein
MSPPTTLAEIKALYGDVKIERAAIGGWRIIHPIGWERANCVMFTHALLPRQRLYVNKHIVEPLKAALELSHERCPEYAIKTIGCFNVRPKRTYGQPPGVVSLPALSMHAIAAAVDINAHANPMKVPLTTDMPIAWREAWKEIGWTWGGTFSVPDPMHLQWGSGI